MPDYINTYVDEDQLLIYEGADFDEVCLADRSGEQGAQVWCWTRRETDLHKASWLRLIVAVDDKDSAATVERVRGALKPIPFLIPIASPCRIERAGLNGLKKRKTPAEGRGLGWRPVVLHESPVRCLAGGKRLVSDCIK